MNNIINSEQYHKYFFNIIYIYIIYNGNIQRK